MHNKTNENILYVNTLFKGMVLQAVTHSHMANEAPVYPTSVTLGISK